MEINSFYIETYGCTSNKADSYIMADLLRKANYNQVHSDDHAQIIIINTCGVKEQTENKIKDRLRDLYQKYKANPEKHVIIAGCLPYIALNYIKEVKETIPNFSAIIDLNNINEIVDIIDQIQRGNKNLILRADSSIDKAKFFINHPPNKLTGIIPISEGCLGSCTYCCVKNARGRLNCYNPSLIIKNVQYQLNQGIKQLYLTSQDCSTYNFENTSLSDLISEITNLKSDFFLRMGMLNPKFLLENFNQLLEILANNKVYKFLHIPIQSGSNRILKLMNRPYLLSDLLDKLEILRQNFPFLSISTDIICGFPTESEHDFLKTINFIKWLKPEILNISKYTVRPGTKAKKMSQVPSKIIKNRSIRLSNLFRKSLETINQKWLNWEGRVLLLHEGRERNQAFARNLAYKSIFIENYEGKMGEFLRVKVRKVDGFNLHAVITN